MLPILFAPRVLVVLVVVFGFALAKRLYAQRQHRLRTEQPDHPEIPADLRGDSARTWVVFTTPYCATCGPVKQQLAALDPGSAIVTVDATERTDLADAFHVRTAPTVLLADHAGTVLARLVGADAVRHHFAAV